MPYTHTRSIFVTTSFVGFHRWPKAPADVAYLAQLHRHVFGVELEITVEHNDRELEFHQVKRALDSYIQDTARRRTLDDTWSCEKIAEIVCEWAMLKWPDRLAYTVEVNEDGENGSLVTESLAG
jgi:6-pyruvoyl-tetrahydropterin synthase